MNYLTQDEERRLSVIDNFEDMAEMALEVLANINCHPKPLIELCGPMSTGGLGNLDANMKAFRKAIILLEGKGLAVFDQIIFQDAIVRLIKTKPKTNGYCTDILDVFYRKIFESGYIKEAWFLPGWETSYGARWERKLVAELGIPIKDLPQEWFDACLD